MSLFVGNLSAQVQHRELERAFRRFGRSNLELKDGYGFVVYEASRDAERALRALQGKTICGERPSITWARRQRPFQSLSNKGVFFRKVSREKEQGFIERGLRRRHSPALNKVYYDEQNENRASDEEEEPRDGSRESELGHDANENGANKGDWKDQSTADLIVDVDDEKEPNPLDAGRWGEALSEGSPDCDLVEEMRSYEEDLHDREKEDIEVTEKDAREKVHGSPTERSSERPSRGYRNTEDQPRRGRDTLVKPQERCYNCGQPGHIMRQCRSRPNVNMFPRDGFDGRRFQYRGLRGTALRRPSGRFRGIDVSRWGPNRGIDLGYGRRTIRRRAGSGGDNRIYEQEDVSSRGKNRHRHRQSDSHKDSRNRDKTKKGRKRSRKRSGSRSGWKRHRSSSLSQSKSYSHSRSSSSSQSRAHSPSPRSHSRSSKSRSRSSSSRSQSLSHRSRSQSSRSISSHSRSRSRTPQSGQSHSCSSKSRSRSLSQSKSPVHSQSHDSQGLRSHSTPLGGNSKALHGSSPEQHARSQRSRELLLPGESRSGPEHSTVADQEESQGVLYHHLSKKSRCPEESEERHPSKKQKLNDTEITKFNYQDASGESQREDAVSMPENVNDFRYLLQDQEQDKERIKITGHSLKEKSGEGFMENMEGITGGMGHKGGDGSLLEMGMASNGGNSMVNFHRGCVQEPASKQDAIFSKDDMAATHQERSVLSLGTAVTGGALPKEAEQDGISLRTSESQKLVHSVYISVMKENLKKGAAQDCDVQDLEAHSFSAARLWTWEAVLYRRIKRGPISVANYDRRQAQNDQFHITDKFVRSSSGWWEKSELFFD
eukprot:c26393_g1_i1 orf=513-2996(+)